MTMGPRLSPDQDRRINRLSARTGFGEGQPDPDFAHRIRKSFALQGLNERIGATRGRVTAGDVEIEVPFSAGASQQHGFFHGGVMGAIEFADAW